MEYGYTGQSLDANGLAYHRARYYDASMGVWNSQDPLELMNRYGYVDGNPVMYVDLNGMESRCPAPDGIRSCSQEFFKYDRQGAANYAINASRLFYPNAPTPAGTVTSPNFDYSGLGLSGGRGQTSSALFISEVLNAGGGLPMTVEKDWDGVNCSNESGAGGGWRTCAGGNATTNWRGHRQLIDYLVEFIGARVITNSLRTDVNGNSLDYFSYTDTATYRAEGALENPLIAGDGLVNDAGALGRFADDNLSGIEAGDYMFINSGNYSSVSNADDHGYIVVGWGNVINCADALEDSSLAALQTEKTSGDQVPYVVDYSYGGAVDNRGWTQDPRPRPFYCSKYSQGDSYQPFGDGGSHEWFFYHIPDYVYIPCDRQYHSQN